LLDDEEDDAPFLLDGQTIVLEDYLAVRPERRERVAARLRNGSLEAGPWYVLADELIPSGESLVRNLLAGRATLRGLGATAPAVLYSPDAFGHAAALPAIATGFGMGLIVLWRGYGGMEHPDGDVARWAAPDGSEALLYHLAPNGYELGASLSVNLRHARDRWESLHAVLAPRATLGHVLLPNGADHHARQPQRAEAVRALATVATRADIRLSSLDAFGRAIESAAKGASVPAVTGELRDSYGYTWTLQGTFATRSALKRRAARAERAMLRDTEPWVALADRRHGASRGALVRAAWKTLLQCHPHDTLCGCSVDAVARAMAARLEDVEAQARGLRADALRAIVGHDPARARSATPDAWRAALVVRNAAARARGGVAIVRIQIARQHVRVGPGSATYASESREERRTLSADRFVQPLSIEQKHDRVESPIHYPWDDIVDETCAAVWVPSIPAFGTHSFPLSPAALREHQPPEQSVRSGDRWLENDALRVDLDASGAVRLETRDGSHAIRDLLSLVSVRDRGDLYTFSPRGLPTYARFVSAQAGLHGPLRATLLLRYALSPAFPIAVALILDAGSSFLRIEVTGRNVRKDHRVRLRVATGLASFEAYADAAFGPVRRERIVAPADTHEAAPLTAPLARYVTHSGVERGATIYSDGLGEYQSLDDGSIALTLLRAVGELSRNDLPERPGHAGWPAHTPGAQELGRFTGRFAIFLHGPRDDRTIDAIERTADDVLHPLVGHTERGMLGVPRPTSGVALRGTGLALSAIKGSEDGAWTVLRCVNLTEHDVSGEWVLGAPIHEARHARLDETPGEPIPVNDRVVKFAAAPRAIVTVLVR
jgi:alpha-mannosidase